MMRDGEVLIHDGNAHEFIAPVVAGERKVMGLVPRNFRKVPCGSIPGTPMSAIQRIPRSEWKERIRDLVAAKAQLSDQRLTHLSGSHIPSRDQNGRGYCWAHSTVSAAILSRMNSNMPYEDLSAYAIACIIKNFRDQGGWNGESMEFLRLRGCPTSKFWPQKSVSRTNDNAATWENAAGFKDTEWDDIPEGDFDLQTTYNLIGIPYALDLNWWSHSICGADAVDGSVSFGVSCRDIETGKLLTLAQFDEAWQTDVYGDPFGTRIWNSWSDDWSLLGMGVLTEAKARNNGAIALRVMRGA